MVDHDQYPTAVKGQTQMQLHYTMLNLTTDGMVDVSPLSTGGCGTVALETILLPLLFASDICLLKICATVC